MNSIEEVLEAHVMMGGTRWDGDRKTTFSNCQCDEPCYLVEEPSHATHVAAILREHLLSEAGWLDPVRVAAVAAALPSECWVFRSTEMSCSSLIGGAFSNGSEWVEETCCLPCRIRTALAPREDIQHD